MWGPVCDIGRSQCAESALSFFGKWFLWAISVCQPPCSGKFLWAITFPIILIWKVHTGPVRKFPPPRPVRKLTSPRPVRKFQTQRPGRKFPPPRPVRKFLPPKARKEVPTHEASKEVSLWLLARSLEGGRRRPRRRSSFWRRARKHPQQRKVRRWRGRSRKPWFVVERLGDALSQVSQYSPLHFTCRHGSVRSGWFWRLRPLV